MGSWSSKARKPRREEPEPEQKPEPRRHKHVHNWTTIYDYVKAGQRHERYQCADPLCGEIKGSVTQA